MFESIFKNGQSIGLFLLVLLVCVVLSFIFSATYILLKKRSFYFKDMPISFVIIPVVVVGLTFAVDSIIYSYIGNENVARYGRYIVALFSALLILKIRSEQRSVEDISYLFFIVTYSLILGLGYLTLALIIYVVGICVIVAATFLFNKLDKANNLLRVVITMPEDLDYEDAFTEVFEKYTSYHDTENIKLSDMGSLYKVAYNVELKKDVSSKEFIDEIRVRNGNLDVNVTLHRDIKPKK